MWGTARHLCTMRWIALLIGFGLLAASSLTAQLTLDITSIPNNTPEGASIFVAGNFNGWNPGLPEYALQPDGDGSWSLTFYPPAGALEFKFTRGDWSMAEGNASGGFQPNHTVAYSGTAMTETLAILSWEDLEGGGAPSTAGPGVEVLSPDFFIPQLNRNRTIRVYTPPGYAGSEDHYRVLYLHDGQNCFDAGTSFSGEWRIDETLDSLYAAGDPGCIVVAIDNGGVHRFDEYNPYLHPVYGGGEGDAYVDFLVETLKPWVDEHYRTLPGRETTGIAGSSMGGLISQYAGFREPDVFSRLGVFSPAYWTADPIFGFVETAETPSPMRVCTVVGELEGPAYVGDVVEMDAAMTAAGLGTEEYWTTVHADGQHAEWYWAREFATVYAWLWADAALGIAAEDSRSGQWPFAVSFSEEHLYVQITLNGEVAVGDVEHVELLDVDGRSILRSNGWANQLPMGGYGPGLRIVRLHMKDGMTWSRGVVYP